MSTPIRRAIEARTACASRTSPSIAPQPLAATHLLDRLACGKATLDEWLRPHVLANEPSGARRPFALADRIGRVLGYSVMAAGAVPHQDATNKVRRNMPDPVPAESPPTRPSPQSAHDAKRPRLAPAPAASPPRHPP
ncbi:GCN5-like N-acetyltransferase [Thauera aminoaromatica S2]|uniref:GCN5-like N-acetyltransferase n=1 Tax=Thauera aminoaromatica S2 TaxID=1234381 RepID=N6Z0E5_THASP|nr:GCN5-like N-acetyltransferase [Thauera aminoaromatica S2]